MSPIILTVLLNFSMLLLSKEAEGDYVLNVTIGSYNNPNNLCHMCNRGCCDFSRGDCRRCDNRFLFCLRPVDSGLGSNCSEPIIISEVDSSQSPITNIMGVPNPLTLSGINTSWSGVQLFVKVEDRNRNQGEDVFVLIDEFHIDINDSTPVDQSIKGSFQGFYNTSTFELSYMVTCSPHFTGVRCESLDPCFNFSCGFGRCVSEEESFTCECDDGYTGKRCEVVDHCFDVNCSRGSCINRPNGFNCVCDPGYTGVHCEVDYCSLFNCNNGGSCVNLPLSFMCECDPGFTGAHCEIVNSCHQVDCGNGSCINLRNKTSYRRCNCTPGYIGEFCKTRDFCFETDCGNGDCVNGMESHTCECTPGYQGEKCELVDHCYMVNCSGSGKCQTEANSFLCECDAGFTGKVCEVNIDDCVNITCSGRGSCEDGQNSFSCVCNNGYMGPTCSEKVSVVMESMLGVWIGAGAGGFLLLLILVLLMVLLAILLQRRHAKVGNANVDTAAGSRTLFGKDNVVGDNPIYMDVTDRQRRTDVTERQRTDSGLYDVPINQNLQKLSNPIYGIKGSTEYRVPVQRSLGGVVPQSHDICAAYEEPVLTASNAQVPASTGSGAQGVMASTRGSIQVPERVTASTRGGVQVPERVMASTRGGQGARLVENVYEIPIRNASPRKVPPRKVPACGKPQKDDNTSYSTEAAGYEIPLQARHNKTTPED